jgi:hypothetical protein
MAGALPYGFLPGMMEASGLCSLRLHGQNFLVATLVPRLLLVGLLLIGLPMV